MPNLFPKRAQILLAIYIGLRYILSFSYSHSAGRFLSSHFGQFILRHLVLFWGLSLIMLLIMIGVSSWWAWKLHLDPASCNVDNPVLPDVTGIGIRLATYIQTLLTIIVEFYSDIQAGVVLHMNLAFIWSLSILYFFAEGDTPVGMSLNVTYVLLCLGNCIFLLTLSRLIFPMQDECDNQETLLTACLRFVTYILWGICHIFFWYYRVSPNSSEVMAAGTINGTMVVISQEEATRLGLCVGVPHGWLFTPWVLERQPNNPVYVANSIFFGFCVGFFSLLSLRLFRMWWFVLCFVLHSSAVDLPMRGSGTEFEADAPECEHLAQICLRSMGRSRMPSRCRILLDAWLWFPSGDLRWIISAVSFFIPSQNEVS